MSGVLYVVGSPIGNLQDITLRSINVLSSVDYILCEDTRVTAKLLSNIDVKNRLVSYNEHNETKRIPVAIADIKDGKTIALISDAGTPLIQDPGYRLVRAARDEGLAVLPVPGPSALVAALSVSGMPTDSFLFLGFLPRKHEKRLKAIYNAKDFGKTTVIYESVYRIKRTLNEIEEVYGRDCEVFIGREMTKMHEEYLYGTVSEVKEKIVGKGEFVIVVGKV